MFYNIVKTEKTITEYLSFKGRIYEREWTLDDYGISTKSESFYDQLKASGFDKSICKKLQDTVESSLILRNMYELKEAELEEGM